MEKKGLFILFLIINAIVFNSIAQNSKGKNTKIKAPNIILIGWDGVQRNHLYEMITANQVPNLVNISKEGSFVEIDVVTGRTDTKAGWAQICTGYDPGNNKVHCNYIYQSIPAGYTIFERAEDHFGKDNIKTIAIIGKGENVGANDSSLVQLNKWTRRYFKKINMDMATKENIWNYNYQRQNSGIEKQLMNPLMALNAVKIDNIKYFVKPQQPFYNAKLSMDLFTNKLGTNDSVGNTTLRMLEKYKNDHFIFFVHFEEPDNVGHLYGENSEQYTKAIINDDEWTGKIINKIKELGLYDNTLVYITSDHGFDEDQTCHLSAPYVFLATNDKKITRDGYREDIAPTILKRLGIDLKKIDPPLDGTPLDEPDPYSKPKFY